MTTEGPNPLRPYYIPPSIGLDALQHGPSSAPAATTTTTNNNNNASQSSGPSFQLLFNIDYPTYVDESSPTVLKAVQNLFSRAVWVYTGILASQPFDLTKTVLQVYVAEDEASRRESLESSTRRGSSRVGGGRIFEEEDEDEEFDDDQYKEASYDHSPASSDDESNYFVSPNPPTSSVSRRTPRSRLHVTSRTGYIPETPTSSASSPRHAVRIKDPSSIRSTAAQIGSALGPMSLWKATNATFIYSLLYPTLNAFIRGLASAIVGGSDDGFIADSSDLVLSVSPGASLFLTCISSALSSVILAPIDTARTYLMLTTTSHGPRSLVRALKMLPSPSYCIPPHLVPITVLSSALPSFISGATPLFLKNYLSLDPSTNPSSWNFFGFLSAGLEIALRFPLETVLRRAQIATYTCPALQGNRPSPAVMNGTRSRLSTGTTTTTTTTASSSMPPPSSPDTTIPTTAASASQDTTTVRTIVPTPQSWRGIIGTMWSIIYEEGMNRSASESIDAELDRVLGRNSAQSSSSQRAQAQTMASLRAQRRRKGQGVQGLYRGWRLALWNVIGFGGFGALNVLSGADGEDFVSRAGQGRF